MKNDSCFFARSVSTECHRVRNVSSFSTSPHSSLPIFEELRNRWPHANDAGSLGSEERAANGFDEESSRLQMHLRVENVRHRRIQDPFARERGLGLKLVALARGHLVLTSKSNPSRSR